MSQAPHALQPSWRRIAKGQTKCGHTGIRTEAVAINAVGVPGGGETVKVKPFQTGRKRRGETADLHFRCASISHTRLFTFTFIRSPLRHALRWGRGKPPLKTSRQYQYLSLRSNPSKVPRLPKCSKGCRQSKQHPTEQEDPSAVAGTHCYVRSRSLSVHDHVHMLVR